MWGGLGSWLASHSSIGSSQSVHLNCVKGTVDRRGPRSFEHAMQGTCCNNESVHALSFHERLSSHGSLGSSQSVHLNCGKGGVDRRGAARSSMQLKARMLQIALDPSTHPLPTSGLSITLFFLVAAEAFTEIEFEGKEVPSLARES